jgi:hypothetical protein
MPHPPCLDMDMDMSMDGHGYGRRRDASADQRGGIRSSSRRSMAAPSDRLIPPYQQSPTYILGSLLSAQPPSHLLWKYFYQV